MYQALLITLAALPVIIILFLIYFRDKNKEPMVLLIKLFLSGFLSVGIVLILNDLLSMFLPFMQKSLAEKTIVELLLYTFLGVALVEESSKWIMTYIFGYKNKEFDELYDALLYAVFVSLGFAFLENIWYVIRDSSINSALMRAVSAVPGHTCFAIAMGYNLSMAKFYEFKKDPCKKKKYLILSIVIPTILHGIYDFCLMSQYQILMTVFSVFIIVLYVFSIMRVAKVAKSNKKIKFKNKFCKTCGKVVTGEFCSRCGTRQE
ncbi:MAG: PrsW family intramembrane metalloprotease [Bacilli bacterium]|nr:PrsW family intramembrane metalloprotease [Bacilli bacterium]